MTALRPIFATSSRSGFEYGPPDRPDSGADEVDKDTQPGLPDNVRSAPSALRPASRPGLPEALPDHRETRPLRFEARIGRSSVAPLKRILVVDDNEIIRALTARFLARLGYAVEVAADGADGWERVRSGVYDLLITDQEMPRLTGLQLAREVYQARLSLPILLVTATPPERDPADLAWNQIWATLLKPVVPSDLVEAVSSVLQAVPRRAARNGQRSPMLEDAGSRASGLGSGASLSSQAGYASA